MDLKPINKDIEQAHGEKLKAYYANKMIPAEKKAYLTKHHESVGPYLAIQDGENEPTYFLDAASQIATLGLGFNPQEFMGTGHHWEAWTNNHTTENVENTRSSLQQVLHRELGWPDMFMTLANSGAEANEIALGQCYRYRKNERANKVLAFEGSFHGRMFVSLFSTWNPSKREPFEYDGFQTTFTPFPEIKSADINVEFPENWIETWANSTVHNFKKPSSKDEMTNLEIDCLMNARKLLMNGEIFAVIVEPMQCEGGDRYATNRFFSALIAMARSFDVPLIFDEVQTGFHLGRKFFWHRDLDLHDDQGNLLVPNYAVCAKKSQVAIVLSHHEVDMNEQYQVGSLFRGMIHAQSLSQSSLDIIALEEKVNAKLEALAKQFGKFVSNPRTRGMAFAIDINEKAKVMEIIGKRFNHALLYYPAGDSTLRFRMNLAMKDEDITFLFDQLTNIFDQVFHNAEAVLPTKISTSDRNTNFYYEQHLDIISKLLKSSKGQSFTDDNILSEFQKAIDPHGLTVKVINSDNFQNFKQKIIDLEKEVYEPIRQTDISKFEDTVNHADGIAIAFCKGDDLAAISFCAPLEVFPSEGGVRRDPNYGSGDTNYMIDTTTSPAHRNIGLGFLCKACIKLLANVRGVYSLSGRNRQVMARKMWRLNLGLGAQEIDYREEDYLDNEDYRDVIYYSIPTQWEEEHVDLSHGIETPLCLEQLKEVFVKENYSTLVNKVCLSNFASTKFLETVKSLMAKLPESLRHGYTASGLSEATDKLAKTIRYNGKANASFLAIEDQYFGHGSFLSRSLSGHGENFFPTDHVTSPFDIPEEDFLYELEGYLKQGGYQALFVEPLEYMTLRRLPVDLLKQIKCLCEKYKTPLVYNETAAASYRYDVDHFTASNIEGVEPDAGCIFLGGQAAMVYCKEELFIDKPLMMISTWDGDELSFVTYLNAINEIEENKLDFTQTVSSFDKRMQEEASKFDIEEFYIENSIGIIEGNLPNSLRSVLTSLYGTYRICPSYYQMKKFLENK
jgi:acetylornithine/succinyldiaminopimelate/putrescine aminotransferase